MNKTELIATIAAKGETTKVQAEQNLSLVLDAVIEALKAGEDVSLRGFGTFKVKTRAARQGRNPQTGAVIEIPAKQAVGFKSQIAL